VREVIETPGPVTRDDFHWTTMGEIADVIGGGTPRTSDPQNFEGGDIPWITPADLSGYTEKFIASGSRHITRKGLESSSARMLPAGAVLYTSRAPIGYVAIAKNPMATNQGFKSFVLKEGVLPEYVYWWLKGSKQTAESYASGTTFLELSGANAKKLPIPMVSLTRQREIVAEIEKQFSRLDEAVANLQRVKANLKRYEKATIESLTNPGSFDESVSGTIADVAISLDNMRKPVNKAERATRPGNVPYLGANGQTGWIDAPLFDEEIVLVVEDETFVGRTAPFSYYFAKKCWVNNHTHVLRARREVVLPKYLNLALSYYPFTPLTTGSTGRRKLTKGALMAAPIRVPSLAQQRAVVAEVDRRLSFVRSVSEEVGANLKRAQSLRQSLLHSAFGESVNASARN